MEGKEFCPLFVDYVRECADRFGDVSREIHTILPFCTSEEHKTCPFFRYIDDPSQCCPDFIQCDMCRYYKDKNFKKFLEVSNTWCLCANFVNCARHKTRESGEIPPDNLFPDGSTLEE
jgi:hypothetical protein